MTINTSNFGKALWEGINTWYGEGYEEHQVEYTSLFDSFTSRKAFEEDVGTSMFGLASEIPQGQPVTFDNAQQGFISRYTHVKYGLGFIITEEMVDDDLYDVIGKKNAKSLAFSMRQTKEIVGANVYNRAFNTAYLGGDGATLVASAGAGGSASHPNVAGGNWTNGPQTASDISEASLEQACIDIMKWENDRGLKVAIMPKSLIIAPDNVFEVERILKSPARVGTADNDLNALMSMGKFPGGVIVNHYLTDADAWFIRTNSTDGMKYFERKADSFAMDNDFTTSNALYKASMRFSFGWTDPRGIWGSPGA